MSTGVNKSSRQRWPLAYWQRISIACSWAQPLLGTNIDEKKESPPPPHHIGFSAVHLIRLFRQYRHASPLFNGLLLRSLPMSMASLSLRSEEVLVASLPSSRGMADAAVVTM